VRDEHHGLVVETQPMQGDPPRMLADASREAPLLVVGGRGSGGFTGLLLGSMALRVLGMAECPVMVVRGGEASDTGRIIVGVDLFSEQKSAGAVEFAFAEAHLRHAELSALNVWEDPSRTLGTYARLSHDSFVAFEELQRADLAATMQPFQQKHPDVTVASQQAVPGTLSQMLVDATRLADVLVIGGDARDGKRPGMRIGALAHIVLHHAHCPVIVVPEH
jgi:nucleotide-binding universal stress UspA family protein